MKVMYTFNDSSKLYAYFGFGLNRILPTLRRRQREPYHFLHPQPNIVIFTEKNIEGSQRAFCQDPLIKKFKINNIFRTLPQEVNPALAGILMTYELGNVPNGFRVLERNGLSDNFWEDPLTQLEDLIAYEEEKYLTMTNNPYELPDYVEGIPNNFGFIENTIPKEKIAAILDF